MTEATDSLVDSLQNAFPGAIAPVADAFGEQTLTIAADQFLAVCKKLRDAHGYEQLIDLFGVDFMGYGSTEWKTEEASSTGFSRGVEPVTAGRFTFDEAPEPEMAENRFAVEYLLLSVGRNRRLRLRVYCPDTAMPIVPSVVEIWNSANWYEREAFDLFGILFDGHPDLRRILTDYGFVGHPFRKDFPQIGHVEMRYDPETRRVIYQPVTIEPRVLVPKVKRATCGETPAPTGGDDA